MAKDIFQPRQCLNSRMSSPEEWQDLVNQIIPSVGVNGQKPAFAFVCYSDKITQRVINNIKSAIDQHPEKNVLNWHQIEFPSFSQSRASDMNQYYKQLMELVEREKKNIPSNGTTIIALYEPIDFYWILTDSNIDNKPRFHTTLSSALIGKDNRNRLLLFGNIPYDLEHLGPNSPLKDSVQMYYLIENISPTLVQGFKGIEESAQRHIIDWTDGHLDILTDVERFCKTICIPERLGELVEHYLSVPIKALQRELVEEKLAGLSCLISKNNLANTDDIDFDGEKCEIRIKKRILLSYFMKTSLFDSKEDEIGATVIVSPKKCFRESIKDVGFFEKERIIGQSPDPGADWNRFEEEMGQICAFFADYEHSKPVFILGAGTSISSGAPVNCDFMNSILSDIYKARKIKYEKIQDTNTLIQNFWEVICKENLSSVRNIVTPKLEALSPSTGHFYLARYVSERKIQIILTTNFDNLIEDSLMDFGIRSRGFIKIMGDDKPDWAWVNSISGKKLKIFKLCGDLFYGNNLALTQSQANSWIKEASDTLNKILARNDCNKFIILGHSFREMALRNWLSSFPSNLENQIKIAFINPDKRLCDEFRNYCRSFHPDGPILIHGNPGKFNNFMQRLHEQLTTTTKV